MTRKEAVRITHQEDVLVSLGVSRQDAEALRRISMTLSRWAERECNGEVERDENDGKPYHRWETRVLNPQPEGPKWNIHRYPVPDRETGALKRLGDILSKTPGLSYYHQTDPRGAALYILRPGDVPEGEDPGSYYSRGVAVY